MQNYIETAKDCVGYTTLKDFQVAAVEACLSGNDVFLSQQTGMGKSAIYELFPFAKDQSLIQDGKLQGPLNARKPFSSVQLRVIALLNGEHKYHLFLVVMLVLCKQQANKTILE